jgi:3-oxoacyl-[acyl-carrier protein] reductase
MGEDVYSTIMSKVALVTGASRGIGRGIALALAAAGYAVVVNFASRQGMPAPRRRHRRRGGRRSPCRRTSATPRPWRECSPLSTNDSAASTLS